MFGGNVTEHVVAATVISKPFSYISFSNPGYLLPALSISVSPSVVVAQGGNVTISCKSEIYQHMTFVLVQGVLPPQNVEEKKAEKYEVTFSIANVTPSNEGSYWCCFKNSLQERTHHSDLVHIWIREQIYPKPSISVSPKELVPLGESAAIHCENEDNSKAHYYLIKEGAHRIMKSETPDGRGAIFLINSVDQSNVGIYWCDYRPESDYQYSRFSERVYINITDHNFPKPSIKMALEGQHAPGESVTILCEGPENNLTFFLHKAMDLRASQETEPGSNTATFLVQNITSEDEGNYTCQYHKSGNPFVWSVPSNPAQLVVEGEEFNLACTLLELEGLFKTCFSSTEKF
nr:immunoglobulin superfamily member 1-like [Anolis sagrei ordinatus]